MIISLYFVVFFQKCLVNIPVTQLDHFEASFYALLGQVYASFYPRASLALS